MHHGERRSAHALLSGVAVEFVRAVGCAVIVALLCTPAAAESALDSLSGQWRGSGTVIMQDDQREHIACRASYEVKDDSVSQALKCGNPRYVFDLAGTIIARGNDLSGRWQERRRKIDGSVSGQVNGRLLELSLEGADFEARLTMVVNGCTLTMQLRPSSERFRAIAVEFRKNDC